MKKITGTLISVHAGSQEDMSKPGHASVEVELEGFAGDAHRSYIRTTWAGDKQAQGTVRRNERQWSAVSVEELAAISQAMDLTDGTIAGRPKGGTAPTDLDGILEVLNYQTSAGV